MIRAREALVDIRPITVEREVLWGECDPAGFVYTPRFGDYAAGAAGYFSTEILTNLTDPSTGARLGLPMKAMSFVFSSFLRPGDRFAMRIYVGEIGNTTFELLVDARRQDGTKVFDATMRRICLVPATATSTRLPDAAREALERYKNDCPGRAE